MKRRKFAPAVAFLAALLVVAFAASTVGAATSKSTATSKSAATWKKSGKATLAKQHAKFAGSASFVGSAAQQPANPPKSAQNPATAQKVQKDSRLVNRAIPGKQVRKGRTSGAAAPSVAAAAGTPIAHSLPINTKNFQPAARGLGAAEQWIYGGYALTPPDDALAEGNGFVVQAVNNLWQITDTNFGHVTNIEAMEAFWGPAIIASGFNCVSDPKANYDNKTRKWYLTEVAYDFCSHAGTGNIGSAVFIGVSTTSDPLGPYNLYVLDTSFDGTFCGASGCLADQPLLGQNANALFISTNSYDEDTCVFGLGDCVFNGAQMYIIDSTAMAAGFTFPNVYYIDIGAIDTPEAPTGCGTPSAGNYPFSAFCWYSVQPATSPNLAFATGQGGTEFALSAEDWFGSGDNHIAVWAFTNTSKISAFIPGPIYWSGVELVSEQYAYPQTDLTGTSNCFAPQACAEQPSVGHTPACDIFYGPFCVPTAIDANDDRMNEVKSVKTASVPAYIWGGLNTEALVADPIHHQHERVAIAWFAVQPSCWDSGLFLCGAVIRNQGYVANWNNDVLYPAIGVGTAGTSGAMVYSLTGNTNYPSVAVSKVNLSSQVSSINVVAALKGQDLLDDLSGYFGFAARFGDYSAAVGDGHQVYLAAEYVPFVDCSTTDYLADLLFGDGTCGGIRNYLTNYGTGLVRIGV